MSELHDLCIELLAASEDALNSIPVSAPGLAGSPERSFISPGLPALDCCDQLTVHVAGITDVPVSPGGLSQGKKTAAKKTHAAPVVTITRCIPVLGEDGRLPLIADMEDAAAQINADGWALWTYLYELWRQGLLFTLCSEVLWDGLRPVGPSGGCAGWTLNFRVTLDGTNPIISS